MKLLNKIKCFFGLYIEPPPPYGLAILVRGESLSSHLIENGRFFHIPELKGWVFILCVCMVGVSTEYSFARVPPFPFGSRKRYYIKYNENTTLAEIDEKFAKAVEDCIMNEVSSPAFQ